MSSSVFFPAAALPPLLMLSAALSAAVEDVTGLDPVVVTAARTPVAADRTLASVSLVTRDEIERRQSRNMTDVLRGLPGVSITSNGGPGQATGVSLRGTPSDNVLVLIDGVRANSATLGGMRWQDLPVEQIERIEVVRGPRSSLYGSEAIGGVVQIFTRKGEGGPLRPRFTAGAGSDNTVSGSLGASGGILTDAGEGRLDVGVGFERTEGFDACNGEPMVGGCFVDQPDKDGYDNGNGSVRAGWRFSDRLALDFNFLRSEGQLEYDGSTFAGDESRSAVQVMGVKVDASPTEIWRMTLSAARSNDESQFFIGERFLNRYDSRRDQLGWLNDIDLAPSHRVTLGVDYYRDEIDTDPVYARTSRDNTGLFGQYLGFFGPHELQASLRHDDNQQFGGHSTGDLAWGYHLGDSLTVTASYGTAFKAPSFDELYFPGFGNPELSPESSRSVEVGLSGSHGLGGWSVNAYQTDIDDLIAYDAARMMPANVAKARIRGVELWADAALADWLLDAAVTLLDPRDRSGGTDDGNLLARQPQQTFRLDADRAFGRVSVGGTLFVSGRRYDDLANNVRLDGFTLLDLRAEYAFSEALRLQARLSNVLDEEYETAAFYNQPGRSVLVTLRYEL